MLDLGRLRAAHNKTIVDHATTVAGEIVDAGEFAQSYARAHPTFKPRTGRLQRSVHWKARQAAKKTTLKVRARTRYAHAIEYGARPHVITPRRKKYLRFRPKGGGVVFAKRVNHPGNRPFKFLYRTANAAGRILQQGLGAGMARVASRFGK